MNPDWKEFLQQNGAEFATNSADISSDQSEIVSFDGPENETLISSQDLLLSNPLERGLIKVSGVDAETFLQNQLTNDIRNVSESNHQLSAWCSPKGRIIATFKVFKREGDFYLTLSRDLIERVEKKLRLYVMMSKVIIEDVSNTMIHFSFSGKESDKQIENILGVKFSTNHETLHQKSISFLYTHIDESTNVSRFDIFVDDIDEAKQLWNQLNEVSSPVGDKGIHLMNILSGLPEITAKSSEDWIPQMVNYIQVEGVDFKKGCYPGQEVVARLNYLGKTKRRMYRIEINTDQLPAIGEEIKSDTDNNAGKILNSVINAKGKVDALAVLKIADAIKSLSLVINDAPISLLELPYSVED